jgi:hypothetical protein
MANKSTTSKSKPRRPLTPAEPKAIAKTLDQMPGLEAEQKTDAIEAESAITAKDTAGTRRVTPELVEITFEAKGTGILPEAASLSSAQIPTDLVARIRTSRERAKDADIAAIAAFVAYGNDLIEVRKLKFPHGSWLEALRNELGIPEKEARWAMDVAENPVTSNPTNWADLPRARSAIHEVTRIKPPEIAQELVDSGQIDSEITAHQVKELGTARVGPTKSKRKRPPFKPPTKWWPSPPKPRMAVFMETMELVRRAIDDPDALRQWAASLVGEYDCIRSEGWWR